MKRKTCEKYVLSVLIRTGDKPCDMRAARRECAENLEWFGSYEALYYAVASHYYYWKSHQCKTNFASEWEKLADYYYEKYNKKMCDAKNLIAVDMTYCGEPDTYYLTHKEYYKYLKGEDPFETSEENCS